MFNSLGDKKKIEFFNSLKIKNKFFKVQEKKFFLIKLKNQKSILSKILFFIFYVLLLGIKIGNSNWIEIWCSIYLLFRIWLL